MPPNNPKSPHNPNSTLVPTSSVPHDVTDPYFVPSMLVWCITHFDTIFSCMERLLKLQNELVCREAGAAPGTGGVFWEAARRCQG